MKRLRAYRLDQKTRDRYAEVFLRREDFIMPYFVTEGLAVKREVKNFYGVYHYSLDRLFVDVEELLRVGVNKILLFGVVDEKYKDKDGSYALREDGLVPHAIRALKERFRSDIVIVADVCFCGYTDHGHCGLVRDGEVLNDETVVGLSMVASLYASLGSDWVAPSAMMDGQVKAIRKTLDENGFQKTKILSYSTKYASNFYGPFREALDSSPSFGDRRSYQLDYRTVWQGIEEARLDIREGADWLMVKPAIYYLDMIHRIKQKFSKIPLAAYHTSGEYMSIKALSQLGVVDEYSAFLEAFTAIKRAGADFIISYYAKDFFKRSGVL